MRETNKLTPLKVARLKQPGRYGDGHGLWLQVSEQGSKAWLFRYMRDGRARQMGLGALHTVSLQEARARARHARQVLLDGLDPIDVKHERRSRLRLEKARALTFKQCADDYLGAHAGAWKNAKHRAQWSATLDAYAHPLIGALPVAAIDTALVLKILRPIWQEKPETASRLRGRIERIFDWATVQEYRRGDNPARWRGHLDALLPAKTKVRAVKHHPALPFVELPAFMAELPQARQHFGQGARVHHPDGNAHGRSHWRSLGRNRFIQAKTLDGPCFAHEGGKASPCSVDLIGPSQSSMSCRATTATSCSWARRSDLR